MARPLSYIQQEIRELSDSDKEALLRQIWEELDGPADPDVDAAWLDEIRARSKEIQDGTVRAVPADEVFDRIQALLKR
jgi:putative addiction module component (TIGR02574 family)